MKTRLRSLTPMLMVALAVFTENVICANTPALSAPPPKGDSPLLTSYLPAVMQVIAHLTNQMKFERVEPSSNPITTSRTTTTKPTTEKVTTETPRPSSTAPPRDVTSSDFEATTAFHRPGIFAPVIPPNPEDAFKTGEAILSPLVDTGFESSDYRPLLLPGFQPYDHDVPVIQPQRPQNIPHFVQDPVTEINPLQVGGIVEPLFLPGNYQPQPLIYSPFSSLARSGEEDGAELNDDVKPYPDIGALPLQNEDNFKYNPLEIDSEELSEENLQYLSPGVREILQTYRDDKKVIDKTNVRDSYQSIEDLFDESSDRKDVSDWLRLRKVAPSQSLIQMLLLYDLLSRDAKKQKLNNYQGYTKDMVGDLVDTSKGTAIEQLKTVLERMLARGDCSYDFANNRARDMVKDLEKPESRMSQEVRYLEPLRYSE